MRIKFKYEYLPLSIVDSFTELNKGIRDYRTRDNLLFVLGLLFLKHIREYDSFEYYIPMGKGYWKKIFGSDYNVTLNHLVQSNIIQKENFKYPHDGVYTGYRLNPDLVSKSTKCTVVKYEDYKMILLSNDEEENVEINDPLEGRLRISVDTRLTDNYISSYISRLNNESFIDHAVARLPSDYSMDFRIYNRKDYDRVPRTVKGAKTIAFEKNYEILYYNKKYYIGDPEIFTKQRIEFIRTYYSFAANKLNAVGLIPTRNTNTLRVYSNLTSLPSKLMPFVRINGRPVSSIDAKCSQFLIFANILNLFLNDPNAGGEKFKKGLVKSFMAKMNEILQEFLNDLPKIGFDIKNPTALDCSGSDVLQFLFDVFNNDFYTVVQNHLGLSNREDAKLFLFTILFGKPETSNTLKKKLLEQYPTVVNIIDAFKSRFGYERFSLGLQQVEAEIFVDNIHKQLTKKRIYTATKHDSIICQVRHTDIVVPVMNKVFCDFGFFPKFKVDHYGHDEITHELVMETNYLDLVEDWDEIDFYTAEYSSEVSDNKCMEDTYPPLKGEDETIDHLNDLDTLQHSADKVKMGKSMDYSIKESKLSEIGENLIKDGIQTIIPKTKKEDIKEEDQTCETYPIQNIGVQASVPNVLSLKEDHVSILIPKVEESRIPFNVFTTTDGFVYTSEMIDNQIHHEDEYGISFNKLKAPRKAFMKILLSERLTAEQVKYIMENYAIQSV